MEDFILCAYLDTVEVASSDDFKRDERITKGNFTAQADAIINGVILEIKNIANFYAPFYNEQGDLTIPAYYRYQMYWQMYLFGLKHAKLVVFNNKEQEIYTFDLDYPPCETIDNMIKEANHFLEALRVQNVNMLRPENVDDYALITPSEDNLANRLSYVPVKQFYDDLMVLTVQIKELETKADECRKQLKLYMQDRPVLYDETKERPMVSWKAVTSNRLDTSRLKEELPEVYNNFLKATTTRVFKMHVTPVDDWNMDKSLQTINLRQDCRRLGAFLVLLNKLNHSYTRNFKLLQSAYKGKEEANCDNVLIIYQELIEGTINTLNELRRFAPVFQSLVRKVPLHQIVPKAPPKPIRNISRNYGVRKLRFREDGSKIKPKPRKPFRRKG